MNESLVGDLFAGRFRIEAHVATGGMGAVYRARHEVLNRVVAVKVIKDNLITDLTVAARFRREARAASRVEHPNITSVYDFGHTETGQPYLVMEHVQGPTLAEVIHEEGAMAPTSRVLRILVQVADALAAAHARGVVHRDLKPQNVLLTTHRERRDFVKILDFGLAKVVDVAPSPGLTQAGEAFGTPDYMSPEQCLGGAVDHRTDIYSFGVLAWETLVGRVPFVGTLIQIAKAHIDQPPVAPTQASQRGDIPSTLDDIVLRCLAKQPEDRFATSSELVKAIQVLREEIGDGAPIKWRKPGLPLIRLMTESGPIASPQAVLRPPATSPGTGPPGSGRHGAVSGQWEEHTEAEWAAPSQTLTQTDPVGEQIDPVQTWEYPVEDVSADPARLLEELACAVRDRGLGSPEIAIMLAGMLEAADRAMAATSELSMLQRALVEVESTARERESRLRRALAQVEHERLVLGSIGDAGVAATLRITAIPDPAQMHKHLQELGARAGLLSRTIRELAKTSDARLNQLHDEQDRQLAALDGATRDEQDYRLRLAALLRELRGELGTIEDPELDALYELAEQ